MKIKKLDAYPNIMRALTSSPYRRYKAIKELKALVERLEKAEKSKEAPNDRRRSETVAV